MSSVGITQPGDASKIYTTPTYEQAVFLDSGTTLSRLPANLVAAMLDDFPGYVDDGSGLYTVPCSYRSQPGTLDFGFGNTVIHVPYYEFIWMSGSTCVFGAVANAASDVDWILGG
jgi:Eukaryotic aspartyl protease